MDNLHNTINGAIVTYALDTNLSITYANDRYYDMIGHSPQEVASKYNNSGLPFLGIKTIAEILKTTEDESDTAINYDFKLDSANGAIVWLRANCQSIQNTYPHKTASYLFIDITKTKQYQQDLIAETERYHIATELTNDIIFEYDIATDTLSHANKYQSTFGRPPLISDFCCHYDKTKLVAPNSLSALHLFCQNLQSGKSTISTELQIIDKDNNFTWCYLKGKTIRDQNGIPCKVIGKIVNIDSQKQALNTLYDKACRDPLTGLYNKTITRSLIENILNTSNFNDSTIFHALLVIDIDNFKSVNDHLGHLIGDEVLINITTQLKALFGDGNIIGRIGGDEFVVFMPEVSSWYEVTSKANAISQVFRYTYSDQSNDYSVSGSIGVAMAPYDGVTYLELFKAADTALYDVKAHGKNSFAAASNAENYNKSII